MRKLVQSFIAVLLLSLLLLYVSNRLNEAGGYAGDNTLIVYNWGDYIDPKLITMFEKQTGLKVIYQTFDSNEAMMAKIAQGGTTFDVAVPSEYAISKMKEEGLLLPLDHKKLPNLKYIDPRFLNLSFDPNNRYSVPYFWGTVGIVYNRNMLGGKKITSWNDLWDKELRNQILLIDGAREVMGMALNSLHYSLNDTNKAHLQEAKRKLDALVPNVKAIVGDEIKILIPNEEAAIGVVWSGDAAEMIAENDKLDYVVPKEGSNLWFDNMIIPKTAKNIEGAHQFINFMLDPKHAAQNAEYVGYATPNKQALQYLPKEITEDKRFYPDFDKIGHLEVYENLGKRMLAYYNELFLEFKMHRK
ncbi:spermidine/putrescine transport system substrate-binding protein [Anoxybacillus voinovskiensis]|uniref:Spermidine/putrescine transport system substrate-binding protein n=1 Tax=Anoxybacteroides voinovskiense TaxID=230470 RepID=A0A840DNW2_9BACL|nr:ABC transporter substrate-binding protein [Anoxybacillus voinovskiensis]MBB4073325.1 spermidine/putrescine transport system substrate-binding protein [Anoxybacillus voinovskiensis]GGJ62225.1 spermidine/putrescine ABC transporter substrate-binding protein [Anoxybacillus voinovskiensis]